MKPNATYDSPSDHEAEGSPGDRERQEPDSPIRRLSTMPALVVASVPHSETGVIRIVNLRAENPDNSDAQDASRPRDETGVASSPAASPAPQRARAGQEGASPSILIIEDTLEIVEVVQATLSNMGLTSDYATRGSAGLDHLRQQVADLLLLDINLPDITGWKILDQIKEHYASLQREMPVIVVITAHGDPANRLVGKLHDIFAYLTKPFTPDEIERVVRAALSSIDIHC